MLVPTSFFHASPHGEETKQSTRPKVLFFDVNETLLDLTPMKKSVGDALNGRADLLSLWFTTMLHYSLVSTVANQYHDFGAVGAAALIMVGKNNGITLTEDQAKAAIKPILSLPPHIDVLASLARLKQAGFKMVSFTNSSSKAVAAQLENARLTSYFDAQLSIEEIGKFKPHADAYSWAARKMGIAPQECMLIAAHGWDVAGAQWAGWRTAFLSRPGQQLYPLAAEPEFTAPHLGKLSDVLVAL
ncbi:HAD family hydrolase [Flavobacterium akiainvivens]|uniref:HAD family hydrolase n=1 Tax=Flavobacterium akiainvivens TaxID=1202724 RepID=A0A0M8MKW0_9FLAO|nr:HAD family hydrolase [Flavobacterium akiainvivens]